jgi:hypothetical protein
MKSKENKMTYNGKKYVTEISDNSCEGCVFADFTIPHVCTLKNNNTKCSGKDNKDNQYRIWVEDTSATKEEKTMSKENKMECNGKKYVTKKSRDGSCNGCAFIVRGDLCECHFYRVMGEVTKNKCLSHHYKDGGDRIWVEDKSIDKKPIKKYETRIIDGFSYKTLLKNAPKEKNHYWIIEDYVDGEWRHWAVKETRSQARECLYEITEGRPKRIRKFIIAK